MEKSKKDNRPNQERYILAFQLSSQKLSLYYDLEKNPAEARTAISKFLKRHGFERIKDTTYISKSKISKSALFDVLGELFERHSWFALSNDTIKCYSINKEIDIYSIIAQNKDLVTEIEVMEAFPPGQARGISSAKNPSAPSGKQQQPAPSMPQVQQKNETVTVSLSELKEYFEAGVEIEVTVKRSDLEAAKKQAESKQKKISQAETPPEQRKAKKPKL